MNAEWEMVKEFHVRFRHPVAETPKALETNRVITRCKWMHEEINEFLESETLYEQADAIVDLIYFALGTLVEMGIPPGELFAVVHEANMKKLWADGVPHYGVDGKTIKPYNWVDPEPQFIEIIERLKLGIAE